jgi:hypothetical protein
MLAANCFMGNAGSSSSSRRSGTDRHSGGGSSSAVGHSIGFEDYTYDDDLPKPSGASFKASDMPQVCAAALTFAPLAIQHIR